MNIASVKKLNRCIVGRRGLWWCGKKNCFFGPLQFVYMRRITYIVYVWCKEVCFNGGVADDFTRQKAQGLLKSVMALFSSELPKICSST